jgi:hypothetical protein
MEILLRHHTGRPDRIYLHKSITLVLPHSGPTTVEYGYESDGNSTPWGLWNIIPPFKYPLAFLFHDKLCGDARSNQDRLNADKDYKWILKTIYRCKVRNHLGYFGVRINGVWRGLKGYGED